MTKIKLCGMMRKEDIAEVNILKPDYIGFVFYDKSFRNLKIEQARTLKSYLNSDIKAVGVFLNKPIDSIIEIAKSGIIDIIQLHGNEDEKEIKKLKKITKLPIFKAYKITNEDIINKANNSAADLILLDSGAGTGKTFDWDLITQINRPYLLAGGLNVDNIAEAINSLNPYGVDVSSGIETNRFKDKKKMEIFVNKVREANLIET